MKTMARIKFVVGMMTFVLLVFPFTIPAFGWEFQMTGAMNWTYEFYNERGSRGFFGPYNLEAQFNTTTTANLNFWWNGPRLAPNLVTGQDASKSYFWVTLDPLMNINQALRLQARIRLGQWNVPQASYYYTQDALGTDNAFSEAQMTMFWAVASLPWGTLGVGKRPWKFGNGLQYDGSDGLSTESLVLNMPYGPFDLGVAFYPHRPARRGQTITIDPYDLVAKQQYFNHADKSGVILNDLAFYVVYNNGPLQAGVLASYGAYHIGPEAQLLNPAGLTRAPYLAQDSHYFHGTFFEKYKNGRIFFNAELSWLYWTDKLMGADAVTLGPTTRYTEQWRYMLEAGALVGPAKISVLNAWTPGPDRRYGALLRKQPAAFVWHPTFDTLLGNFDVFRPYSFILSYNYGAGLNAYNLSLDGYMRDAWVVGARMDYAVASNLNIYGTFLWAERTSKGYGWACIAPNDNNLPPQFIATPNDGNVQWAINGAAGSPNIPDTALGWEVNLGLDWQLLEGYTVGFLAGYWQPGRWFSYACIDRSVPNWNVPAPANYWGTRPDRTIDPVVAGQFTMNFSF
jgi:hypothetical protein